MYDHLGDREFVYSYTSNKGAIHLRLIISYVFIKVLIKEIECTFLIASNPLKVRNL